MTDPSNEVRSMTAIDRTEGAVERAAGRGMVAGTVIGLALVTGIFTFIMLYVGAEFVPAVGVGLFAAFWGGPGFGGMMGAILGAIRAKEAIASFESSSCGAVGPGLHAGFSDHDEIPHETAA